MEQDKDKENKKESKSKADIFYEKIKKFPPGKRFGAPGIEVKK
jgi:hypothetical protein